MVSKGHLVGECGESEFGILTIRERKPMLVGEYNHSIDEKGRLIIPTKFRDEMKGGYVMCNGLEGCAFMYSQKEWDKFVSELDTLPRISKDAREFQRYFFGSASEGSLDRQGRVLVPTSLRRKARLDKDVTLVGVRDRIEIWDTELWEKRNDRSEEEMDKIVEGMAAIGIRI